MVNDIKLAGKTRGEILDGIDTALNEIKKQDWYKKLSQRDKDAVDKQIKQDNWSMAIFLIKKIFF